MSRLLAVSRVHGATTVPVTDLSAPVMMRLRMTWEWAALVWPLVNAVPSRPAAALETRPVAKLDSWSAQTSARCLPLVRVLDAGLNGVPALSPRTASRLRADQIRLLLMNA